jgi:hypothetical protein
MNPTYDSVGTESISCPQCGDTLEIEVVQTIVHEDTHHGTQTIDVSDPSGQEVCHNCNMCVVYHENVDGATDDVSGIHMIPLDHPDEL